MSVEYCNEIWYGHFIPQEKIAVDDIYDAIGDDDVDRWVSEVNAWSQDEGLLVGERLDRFGPGYVNRYVIDARDIVRMRVPSSILENENKWREIVEKITGEKCDEYPMRIVAFCVR